MEVSLRWKTLIGVVAAALVLAGCRKSETATASAPPAPTPSETLQHPPFGFLDVPRENDAMASGSVAFTPIVLASSTRGACPQRTPGPGQRTI